MSFLNKQLLSADSNISIDNGSSAVLPSTFSLNTSLTFLESILGVDGAPGTIASPVMQNNTFLLNNTIFGNGILVTNDDTPITLIAIPIPTNNALCVSLTLTARDQSTFLSAFGETTAGVKNEAGTVTSISTLPAIVLSADALFTVSALWTIVGTNLVLQITGLAAQDINWACDFKYFIT